MSTIIFLISLLLLHQTIIPTEAKQENWKTIAIAKIKGPKVDQVWPYIADFCNIYKIFPTDVSFCVRGSYGQPGQIRYGARRSNATLVLWAREELLVIDTIRRYLSYQLHENNMGLNKFNGTMQVLPNNGDNGSIFKWSVDTYPIVGLTYKSFVDSFHENIGRIVVLIEKLVQM